MYGFVWLWMFGSNLTQVLHTNFASSATHVAAEKFRCDTSWLCQHLEREGKEKNNKETFTVDQL